MGAFTNKPIFQPTIAGIISLVTATITGALILASGSSITGHLIPTTSGVYDIGSPTSTWRKAHIPTIYSSSTPFLVNSHASGTRIESTLDDTTTTSAGLTVNTVPSGLSSSFARLISLRKSGTEKAYIDGNGELYVNSAIRSLTGSMSFNAFGSNLVTTNFDPSGRGGTLGFAAFNGSTGLQFVMSSLYKGYIGFPTVFDTDGIAGTNDLYGPVGSDFEFRGRTSSTKAFIGSGATTTPSNVDLLVVSTLTTSTVQIGDSIHPLCIKGGDSDRSGFTWVTVNNGVLTASVTPCNL